MAAELGTIGANDPMVEGTEIEVQHVRMTVDDNDEYWEHTIVDWYLAPTGLPVEVV